MAKRNMSFLPEEYLERRAARRTNLTCIVLFVIVMGAIVTGYLFTDKQRREVYARHAQVNREFTEAALRIEQLEELQSRKEQMLHKANVTSALVERVPRSVLLAELTNQMPAPMGVLEFELKTQVVRDRRRPRTSLERRRQELEREQQEQVPVPEVEMECRIVGVAPTDVEVAQYMAALGQHPLFDDVTLQYSEETVIEKHRLREFEITMQIARDVDPRQMEAAGSSQRTLNQNPMSDGVQIISPSAQSRSDEADAPVVPDTQ